MKMDASFETGKYPGYTLAQLISFVESGEGNEKMVDEICRRKKVASGDKSVMTSGEKLRFSAV
jgi:hypothetical protein